MSGARSVTASSAVIPSANEGGCPLKHLPDEASSDGVPLAKEILRDVTVGRPNGQPVWLVGVVTQHQESSIGISDLGRLVDNELLGLGGLGPA